MNNAQAGYQFQGDHSQLAKANSYAAAQQTISAKVECDPNSIAAKVDRLHQLLSRLSDIATSAERVADTIQGSRPEKNDGGGKPASVPNGLVERLDAVVEIFEAHINRVDTAVTRINSALG